jgi:excisionase family DNA binding protein
MKNGLIEIHSQSLGVFDPDEFFDNQILTVKGAARFLKFSEKTIYKLVKSGKIPFKRVGSEYRFLTSELLEALKKGK